MARFALASGLIAFVLLSPAAAQPLVELEEFIPRKPPSMVPAIAGRTVAVRGVVSASPVRIWEYVLVPIQNERGTGLTLEMPGREAKPLTPGDYVEVAGLADHRAGLPVIRPDSIRILGRREPPPPQKMSVEDLKDPRNLGRYVEVEARVGFVGENAGGDLLFLAGADEPVTVFLPRNALGESGLRLYRGGDRVRIFGISGQYCPVAPHDRQFQLTIGSPGAITLISRGFPLPATPVLGWSLSLFAMAAGIWWWRERQMNARHRVLRGIVRLSESVLEATTQREILVRLRKELPRLVGASDVAIYVFREAEAILEPVTTADRDPAPGIPVATPLGSMAGVVALCFRNRSLLRVPDTRNSPIVDRAEKGVARAAVCVPMFSQSDTPGVLAVWLRKRTRRTNPDQDVALQHLGNQIAAFIKLDEQRQMREQLLRSEKMAAAGQLISAIANDLRSPVENIARAARVLGAGNGAHPEVRRLVREADRGLEIIDHLLSFARMEQRAARPLDLHALVSDLIEMRSEEARRKSFRFENQLAVAPVLVIADRSQMEQAMLTVLIKAEHAAANAPDRCVRVSSRLIGRRILLTFQVKRTPATARQPELDDYVGIPVAQAVFGSHGGELRHISDEDSGLRIEIEMPVHEPAVAAPPAREEKPTRVLTCLILEPDDQIERRLLAMLAARGHRAIPVRRPEDAADLVQRMQFDVMFCASRLPGLNWLELFHRVRRRVGSFALMNETWDSEAAQLLERSSGRVIARPVQEAELDEFLALADSTLAQNRT